MKKGNPNHPKKGSKIKIEPIRKLEHIQAIMENLSGKPRERCLFVLGINWGLRASDLVKLKVGKVRTVELGDSFIIYEKKTGKERRLTMNKICFIAIHELIGEKGYKDDNYLFQGQRGQITVQYVNLLMKQWCKDIRLKGRYGSHTLRKTFGYVKRVHQRVDIPTLMEIFGHSTQKMTLQYLCIQDEEVRDVYMNGIGG